MHGTLRTVKDSKRKLAKRYGRDFIEDLYKVKKNPAWTLKRVGDKHGVTREYIRQVYEKVFGHIYTVDLAKKTKMYKKDTVCVTNPLVKLAIYSKNKNSGYIKNAETELSFVNKCKDLKYTVEFREGRQMGMIVNGHKVLVRTSNNPRRLHPSSKVKYAVFRINDFQKEDCDFIACHIGTIGRFFIVPIKKFLKNTIYIAEEPSTFHTAENKFHKYEEAWHLLKEA